ncbi:hypothetical protein FOL47_009053 [Perkinsus chesapeaki]|uniref:Uncharacterized protein n=1 Tax=Perkinsus chesapeaki TaxID=330153 RepID=A0A7J6MSE2_PERCH|nr:hypothetical protein FOL47_009053 [Perkinsus chesapeaki]
MSIFPSDLVDRCGGRYQLRELSRVFHNKLRADPFMPPCSHAQADRFVDWLLATVRVGRTLNKTSGLGVDDLATQKHRNRWIYLQFESCDELLLPPEFVLPYIHGMCVVLAGIPLPPESPLRSYKSSVVTPVRSPRDYASPPRCDRKTVLGARKTMNYPPTSRDNFSLAFLDM